MHINLKGGQMKSKILGIFIAALVFAACSTYSTLDSSKEYAFVVDENQSTMLKNPEFGKTRIYVYRKDTAQSFNIGYLRPFDIKIEYANKKSEILASSRMHSAYFKDIEVESGIQVHGLLGTDFLLENKWIVDFNELTIEI